MPCDTQRPSAEEEYAHWEKLLRHDSPTAAALCQVMAWVEDNKMLHLVPDDAVRWWEAHKERDEQRLQAELAKQRTAEERRAAIAKLTPHERKLLGFK